MKKACFSALFYVSLSLGFFVPVAGADTASLSFYKQQVDIQQKQVEDAKARVFQDKSAVDKEVYEAQKLLNEYEEAKSEYQKLSDFDAQNPGAVRFEQLTVKRKASLDAHATYKFAEDRVIQKQDRLTQSALALNQAQNALNRAIGDLKYYSATEIERRLSQERKKFEVTQRVPVDIEYICAENQMPKQCKTAAQESAEQKAVEKGAIVTVSSITQMRDLQIESEVVKNEVNANITKKEQIKSEPITRGGSFAIHYQMIATVQPYLSDSVLNQIRSAIATDVLGEYVMILSTEEQGSSMSDSTSEDFLAKLKKEAEEREAELRRQEEAARQAEAAERRRQEALAAEQKRKEEQAEKRRLWEEEQKRKKVRAPVLVF